LADSASTCAHSWAVGILSAQFFGAGQAERIRNTIALAAVIVNLVLLPLYIANIFYADNFIGFGSSNADVIRQGQSYLWYVLPSLSFVAVILCYDNALRALNEVKTPMVISLIAIILNIARSHNSTHIDIELSKIPTPYLKLCPL